MKPINHREVALHRKKEQGIIIEMFSNPVFRTVQLKVRCWHRSIIPATEEAEAED